MKNIHLLPTDKPSRIYLIKSNNKLGITSDNPFYTENMGSGTQNQHIYIINSEEIKEGQNYIGDGFSGKNKFKWHKSQVELYPNIKKDIIILTTDQELIKDGVQAIDDEFLEWFVKNPSCERVEVESKVTKDGVWTDLKGYVELPTTHSIIHKIIIPKEEPCTCTDECLGYLTKTCKRIKEEPKQQKLEEAIELAWSSYEHEEGNLYSTTFKNGFKLGSIWEKDQNNNKYTEEDFLKFSEWVSHNDWVYLPSKACWVNEEQEELEQKLTTKELFKKFKKK